MYKIKFYDRNQKKIRTFKTEANSKEEAITSLFDSDLKENPPYTLEYEFIEITKDSKTKEKGSIYVTSECDMGKLIMILCNNDYEVKVRASSDLPFLEEYRLDFKRVKGDYGDEHECF